MAFRILFIFLFVLNLILPTQSSWAASTTDRIKGLTASCILLLKKRFVERPYRISRLKGSQNRTESENRTESDSDNQDSIALLYDFIHYDLDSDRVSSEDKAVIFGHNISWIRRAIEGQVGSNVDTETALRFAIFIFSIADDKILTLFLNQRTSFVSSIPDTTERSKDRDFLNLYILNLTIKIDL